ncbi:MAG TPA: hypothetical protein DCE80_16120, partial [Ignavibacteriales bacterium]|nr:hypothetical protein [Ignavibacteriales bacterium]
EAIEPDWSIIQDIADKLIYENSIIIKARALLKYKSNPNVHKSNPGVDNKSSTAKIDWSKFERRGEAEWSKYIVDDINDDVEWNDRNVISKHNLLVISKTSRINKSAVVAVLSGIGSTLLFLLIMFLISILWYFMLNRLSELSRAIQWRFSMTKFLNPTVYFILGIISVAISFYLSLQRGTGYVPNNFAGLSGPQGIGAGVDIAADGGAAGFAILSGICFFCSAYLIKNKQ